MANTNQGTGKRDSKPVRIEPSAAHKKSYNAPVLPKHIHGWEEGLEALGVRFRWNIRGKRFECQIDSSEAWHVWRETNDRIEAHVRERMMPDEFGMTVVRGREEIVVPYQISKSKWSEYMDAHGFTHEVDPFLERLNEMPAWDAKPRLDTMLIDLLGAPDTELNRFASRQPLIAAAAYAIAPPGTEQKLDESPLLQGPGDIGKSSVFALPVQLLNPDWFTDGLELSDTSKVWAEKLEGRVIVEIGEMTGSTRADKSRVKSRLASQNDGRGSQGLRQASGIAAARGGHLRYHERLALPA